MNCCPVCNGPKIENHFGAAVCRSCSAFFRRFVLSRKKSIECTGNKTCIIDHKIKKFCRSCRMMKCVESGMIATRINEPIVSKNTDKINSLVSNYPRLMEERQIAYGNSDHAQRLNIGDATIIMEADYKLTMRHLDRSLKEFKNLSKSNKDALFVQFYSRCIGAESFYHTLKDGDMNETYMNTGDSILPCETFFCGKKKHPKLTDKEIGQMFKPFWEMTTLQVKQPLAHLKLDTFEFASLVGLMLFDGSYMGIDDYCVEMCYQIRNIIFREICAYHREKNEYADPAVRLAEIVSALTLMEKAKYNLQQQLQLCCLHKLDHNEQICLIFNAFS
ncbi:unnamed protein product [Caenorhabditis angaria]|uniref:Nuclear receptor domain-containing protein n=1 Tax=Caenorhabditis angaria TaxID=860376 RepID=A0A9P1N538_9PELO|nr:unnamed protein product [Caenorhabditis angaria]